MYTIKFRKWRDLGAESRKIIIDKILNVSIKAFKKPGSSKISISYKKSLVSRLVNGIFERYCND